MRLPRITTCVLAALACSRPLQSGTASFELEPLVPAPVTTSFGCLQWLISHNVPFGLPGLAGHRLAIAHGRRLAAVGLGLSLRGPARHREIALSATVGARLRAQSIWAATLTRYRISQGAVSRQGWGLAFALEVELGDGLSMVVAARDAAEPFARRRLELRLLRRLGDDSLSSIAWERRPARADRLQLIAERRIDRRLQLRFGTSSGPRQFIAGAGARAGKTHLDYLIRTHADLGPSHAVRLAHDGSCSTR